MLGYDWQTISVTLVALGALLVVVRRVLDLKGVRSQGSRASGPSCPSCALGAAASATHSRKQQPPAAQAVQLIRKRRTG